MTKKIESVETVDFFSKEQVTTSVSALSATEKKFLNITRKRAYVTEKERERRAQKRREKNSVALLDHLTQSKKAI